MVPIGSLSLKRRVFQAGSWTAGGYLITQAIRFSSNLIMTRLLVPKMFGLMAIASMVMYGLALVSDIGIGPNVIYSKRGGDQRFLNTAWSIQIRRGGLIWLVALLVSVAIATLRHFNIFAPNSVYAQSKLSYVVAILSFSAVISGFESTKLFEANRNLLIHRIVKLEILSQLSGFACMIAWAAMDPSIWSLVAGSIFSTFIRVFLSHLWLPGHPNRWEWDHEAFREIIHYGKWIFASSVLGFLVNSGDRIILGGLLSATSLGIYTIAFLLINALENAFAKVISDVSFPALSEVARDRQFHLRSTYYRIHTIIASLAYCIAGVMTQLGPPLIGLIYDRRYIQAGPMLQILAVGLIAVPFRIAPSCFQALGMPKLLSRIIFPRILALFILTPISYRLFGLPGALWAIVFSNFAGIPQTIYYLRKYHLLNVRRELILLLVIPASILFGKALHFLIVR